MTSPGTQLERPRQVVFDALRVASPQGFTEKLRHSFVNDGLNLRFDELDMDSLGQMEFCIAIELATGLTLLPSQLAELASTDAVEHWIRRGLA
jgi:acyl carrier protein